MSKMKSLAASLVLTLGIAGCGGDDEGPQNGNGGGLGNEVEVPNQRVTGGQDTEPPASAPAGSKQAFLGKWNATGTATATFTGSKGTASETMTESFTAEFEEGADTDLVFIANQTVLPAKLKGNTALFEPGHEWEMFLDGVLAKFKLLNGTASLDGGIIRSELNGTVEILYPGETVTATFSWRHTLTKLTK